MTALVKNTAETRFAPPPASAPSGTFFRGVVGFGPAARTEEAPESGMLARIMLLVLYPAMASAALVLAAFMLSGRNWLV